MKTPQYLLCLLSRGVSISHPAAFEFSGPLQERDYPFPVKDSGVGVQVDEATVVEWVDNERVIFSVLRPGEPRLRTRLYNADRQDHFAPGLAGGLGWCICAAAACASKYAGGNPRIASRWHGSAFAASPGFLGGALVPDPCTDETWHCIAIWDIVMMQGKVASGICLVCDGKVVRLIAWLVGNDRASLDNTRHGLVISPEGCKVAFKHATGERIKSRHSIRMIDLC